MRIIQSKIQDIYFNLALENYILTEVVDKSRILLTYINSPCVVIGRFQNPWIECNLKRMHEDGVKFVRRQSGGGTVYHDEHNLNYSVIAPKGLHDKNWNFDLIVKTLSDFDIDAIYTDRGDIRINNNDRFKISGSAFKEKKDTAFHHGTMLIDSDLEKLNLYIHSNKDGLESKSIASKRSTVTNLKNINPNITSDLFLNSLFKNFAQDKNPIIIDKNHELYNKIVEGSYYKSLIDLKWRYLETPKFFVAESFEGFSIHLEIKKTIIEKIEVENESYHPVLLNLIAEKIKGNSILEITNIIDQIDEKEFLHQAQFKLWFTEYFDLNSIV